MIFQYGLEPVLAQLLNNQFNKDIPGFSILFCY